MIKHQMNLSPEDFEKIKKGTKVIESRLYDQKRRSIKTGDEIVFSSSENEITVTVTDLLVYTHFKDLFLNNDPTLFGGGTLKELMTIYKYYSKYEEEKFGVVGIKFKTDSSNNIKNLYSM